MLKTPSDDRTARLLEPPRVLGPGSNRCDKCNGMGFLRRGRLGEIGDEKFIRCNACDGSGRIYEVKA